MGTRFEGNDMEAARLRSLSGQDEFDERDDVPWRDDYAAVLADEWPWYKGPDWNRWKLAAYVAWASYRGMERWPKTLNELCRMLGWSNGTQLRKYRRRYPQLEQMVSEAVMEPLLAKRMQVLDTLGVLAAIPDYKTHNDRKLFLEMTGMHEQRQAIDLRTTVNADAMAQKQEEAQGDVADWDEAQFGDMTLFDDAVTATLDESEDDDVAV